MPVVVVFITTVVVVFTKGCVTPLGFVFSGTCMMKDVNTNLTCFVCVGTTGEN